MKQSTKLLSLLLALVMAFSCMTVIGNALKSEVTKDTLSYDAVDDAIISAEQGKSNHTSDLTKQSTKLLSLLLALVMAFSCMTVIGNALKSEVTKDTLSYDAVDDAIICRNNRKLTV